MDTVELAYEEMGGHNADALIILHGFFASARNWRKIAEKLSARYHVYVVDLRNHGNSPHHVVMDYTAMSADVLAFMDQHSLSIAHIIGHSMGGKIAMWLALNHPERMNKLVVVDIAPKRYDHSFDVMIQALIDLPLAQIKSRKDAELLLADAIPELEYRQFLLQNLFLNEQGYLWRIDLDVYYATAANIIDFPAIEGLVAYSGNSLFISGAQSSYVAKSDVNTLFPKAQFESIANAKHWVHVQQPDAFVEVVVNFLQNR